MVEAAWAAGAATAAAQQRCRERAREDVISRFRSPFREGIREGRRRQTYRRSGRRGDSSVTTRPAIPPGPRSSRAPRSAMVRAPVRMQTHRSTHTRSPTAWSRTVPSRSVRSDRGDRLLERRERRFRRMPVGVAAADLDRRDPRPEALQQRRQAGIGAAVVRDLEHVDRLERERRRDVALGVGAQQHRELPHLEPRHHRAIVRVAVDGRSPGRSAGGHSTSKRSAADRDRLARDRRDLPAARRGHRGREHPLHRRAPARAAVDHEPRRVAPRSPPEPRPRGRLRRA